MTFNHLKFIIVLLAIANTALANRDITKQANLHPMDTFTPEAFKEGEWSYAQPPILAPGYSFYGITDNLTVQLDYTAWIGGVPSLNLRYRFTNPKNLFQLAVEGMGLYLPNKLDELDKDQENLYIKREGPAGFLRMNSSWKFSTETTFYLSAGLSYSKELIIANEGRSNSKREIFNDLYDPILMLGASYLINPDLLFIINASYGETWLYFENRPRKLQGIYGFRWTPFKGRHHSILHNMAIDLAAIFVYFNDADEKVIFPIPLFPVFTWQW